METRQQSNKNGLPVGSRRMASFPARAPAKAEQSSKLLPMANKNALRSAQGVFKLGA